MGIPSYFAYLLKQNPQYLLASVHCKRLFLDLNGVIHTCTRQAVKETIQQIESMKHKHVSEIEHHVVNQKQHYYQHICQQSFQLIAKYIEFVFQYTAPTDLLYIAIDGVAPMAKIQQQRLRRFRAHKEKIIKQAIYRKHQKVNIEGILWDSNIITPGTPYMTQLSQYLHSHLPNTIPVIFSDSSEHGEGEHKIIEYIRQSPPSSCTDVIYGLDADLIMLSMLIQSQHNQHHPDYRIYLLRETLEFGTQVVMDEENKPILSYFNIHLLQSSILDDIALKGIVIDNPYRWIVDYLFLCFLLGNDFLPHQHTLHIIDGGIEYLLNTYVTMYKVMKIHVVNEEDGSFDKQVMIGLFEQLQQRENQEMLAHVKKMSSWKYRIIHDQKSIFDKAIDQVQQIKSRNIEKRMLTDFQNWKTIYYEEIGQISDQEEMHDLFYNYLFGLKWCLHYYLTGKVAQHWFYRYPIAPTFSELKSYLIQTNIDFDVVHSKHHVNVYEQQLLVLPSSSHSFLPSTLQESLQSSLPMLYYFPENFEMNTFGKRFLWESYPIIPCMNFDVVHEFVKKHDL